MEKSLIKFEEFSMTRIEMETVAKAAAERAILDNTTAEMLWKLKVMEDVADQVKSLIYEFAVKQVQHMLNADTGTVTVGKCDINIQIPNFVNEVQCKASDKYKQTILEAQAHLKAIQDIAKGIEKPMVHPLYGKIEPATYTAGKPKFVVKPHRI